MERISGRRRCGDDRRAVRLVRPRQADRIASEYRDYGAAYPQPGWVEQDPNLLIARTMEACRAAVAQSRHRARRGFGPSASPRSARSPARSTEQGRPVRPMFSWQDARTGGPSRAAARAGRSRTSTTPKAACRWAPPGSSPSCSGCASTSRNCSPRTHKFVQNQDLVLRAFGADDFYTDICCMAFYGVVGRAAAGVERAAAGPARPGAELFRQARRPPGTQVGTLSRRGGRKDRVRGGHADLRRGRRSELQRGRHGRRFEPALAP